MTPSEGLASLHIHAENNADPQPNIHRDQLPLAALYCIEAVFQPRDQGRHYAERLWLLEDLGRAIQRNGERGLDPIVVWWSGQQWIVIDGHHRLKAYHEAGTPRQHVPVELFEGSLDEARLEASRRNTKNALHMRQEERLQAAWRLVCTSDLTKGAIAVGTAVCARTVAHMRSRLRQLLDAPASSGWTRETLGDEEWKEVKRATFDTGNEPERDYDSLNERTAREWAGRLVKNFGRKPLQNPEAFALALSYVSERLPAQLIGTYCWSDLPREEPPSEYDFS